MIEDKGEFARGSRGHHHGSHRGPADAQADEKSAIKQIVVHIAKAGAGLDRLDLAVHLAKAVDAQLVAVGTSAPEDANSLLGDEQHPGLPLTPFSVEFPRGSEELALSPRRREIDDVGELERNFWERAKFSLNAAHEWQLIEYANPTKMISLAKTADLTILGQYPSKDDPGSPGFHPEEVAATCGRPVLIIPLATPAKRIGSSVTIAWDGSQGAVRALYDAMPLMRDARKIGVLEVDGDGRSDGPDAYAVICLLERHGFQAFTEARESGNSTVADAILTCAEVGGADLLVAGLSAHSKIRETLFGSVCHELLRRSGIPLLISR